MGMTNEAQESHDNPSHVEPTLLLLAVYSRARTIHRESRLHINVGDENNTRKKLSGFLSNEDTTPRLSGSAAQGWLARSRPGARSHQPCPLSSRWPPESRASLSNLSIGRQGSHNSAPAHMV